MSTGLEPRNAGPLSCHITSYQMITATGWDRYLMAAPPSKTIGSAKNDKKVSRKLLQNSERLFSTSSVTSPAAVKGTLQGHNTVYHGAENCPCFGVLYNREDMS